MASWRMNPYGSPASAAPSGLAPSGGLVVLVIVQLAYNKGAYVSRYEQHQSLNTEIEFEPREW